MKIYTTVPIAGLEAEPNVCDMAHLDMRHASGAFAAGMALAARMRTRASGERVAFIKEFGDASVASARVLLREPGGDPLGPLGRGLLAALPMDPANARAYLGATHVHDGGTLHWLSEAAAGYRFGDGPVLDALFLEYEDHVGHDGGRRGWSPTLAFRELCTLHPATKAFAADNPDGDGWKMGMPLHMKACDLMNIYAAKFRAALIGAALWYSGWCALSRHRGNYGDADITPRSGETWATLKLERHGLPQRRATPIGMGFGAGWLHCIDAYLNDATDAASEAAWAARVKRSGTPRIPFAAPPFWAGDPRKVRDGWVLEEKPETYGRRWCDFWFGLLGPAGRLALWSNGRKARESDVGPEFAGQFSDAAVQWVRALARRA